MISEDFKSYLSNIEESLFDEKRIVTYSWLSKTFGIHCNVSKQLLYTFYENSPKKDELSVTYLLIGLPKEGESRQISIVKDRDLQEAEDNLKTITSKHIYSIQKCQDLSDINVLYTPPADESVDVISKGVSAIDFNNIERDNALLAKLRHSALPVVPTPPAASTKKTNLQPVTKTKSAGKNEESNKIKNTEKGIDSTSENKKSVIPSMFSNATGSKKKPTEKAANVKKPQGIGAFFKKAESKPNPTNNEPKKVSESYETQKEGSESKETDSKIKERLSPLKENKAPLNVCTESKNKKEESPKETAVKAKKVENKPKSTSKKAPSKGGKKKAVKKEHGDQKKRKRLVVLSDSDSNSGSEDEEELRREPTPEPEPTFVPDEDMDDDVILGTPEPSKKRRKRKLVSKTYICPDGFMVTEKEYEDVSASEEEEEQGPEKKFKGSSAQDDSSKKPVVDKSSEKRESPKNKNPSPQKTKQASLMSFFKKK